MIYCDNGATSHPKPPQMLQKMIHFSNEVGGSPGRSGHTVSMEAERVAFGTRSALAQLFNIADPQQIAFTKNVTEALNYAIQTNLKPGDHVLTTSVEHNSVMRPLRHMEANGVELAVVDCDPQGFCSPEKIRESIRPNSKMVVINHASNVVGTIQDAAAIGALCREKNLLFVVDAAQSAGVIPIDVCAMNIDFLCFTGHKGLLGPTGTGGVYVNPALTIRPFMFGGTGSNSEFETQPTVMPDIWESGTMNIIGVAGLGGSLDFLTAEGIEKIHRHEIELTQFFVDELLKIDGVTVYGPLDAAKKTAVTSINIEGVVCSEVGDILDRAFGIMTRTGLHCAPSAHKTIGTFPKGTVRFGFSCFTTMDEVKQVLKAVKEISAASRE